MANEVAYGFVTHRDIFNDRAADNPGMTVITSAVEQSAAVWTQLINAEMTLFVERTTQLEVKYWLPGGGMLEPLTADGNPRPRRYTGSYDVGFPVRWAGTGFGTNRETRVKATVGDYNRWVVESMNDDKRWIQRHIIKALLWSAAWTFVDESRPSDPNISVQPLANGDTVTYLRRDGNNTTDTHYLAQAAAIADGANPFPTIYDELFEHPSNMLDQNGFVVVYVASGLVASIEALTNLKEVKNQIIIPGIQDDRLSDAVLQFTGFGDKVIGYIDNCVIVRWSALPAGYMLAHAPSAPPILAMREEPETQLQGLFTEIGMADGNHQTTRLLRKAGFGVQNRVGALAYYIGNAAYQNPTGYDPSKAE